jgi:predicted unusual protein kinase regulating ubiquinone biosynthesis (AarF/ABC1/UbiB family)
LAIASLFDGPLRCWRSRTRVEDLNVAEHAFETVVKKADGRYAATFEAAKHVKEDVRAPEELVSVLVHAPARPVSICFSHGDLHLKNVFVREGSYETVLIDFNRAGFLPSSRDPAELDAALGFSEEWHDTELQERLYSKPLLSERVLCRTEFVQALAIEQLRRQIAGTILEDEYRLMLACHCFYWAAKGSVPAYPAIDRLA